MRTTKIILEEGNSWIHIIELDDKLSITPEEFERLKSQCPQEKKDIYVFNRYVKEPRYSENFGLNYTYGCVFHEGKKIEDDYILRLRNWVRKHSKKNYEQLLINWYLNGDDYISPHWDKNIKEGTEIYSFSFGQRRRFIITSRDKQNKFKLEIPLKNNTCVIMGGDMQKFYKHGVPKQKAATGCRINVTLRIFK